MNVFIEKRWKKEKWKQRRRRRRSRRKWLEVRLSEARRVARAFCSSYSYHLISSTHPIIRNRERNIEKAGERREKRVGCHGCWLGARWANGGKRRRREENLRRKKRRQKFFFFFQAWHVGLNWKLGREAFNKVRTCKNWGSERRKRSWELRSKACMCQ